jgi:hypothetical protein
MARRLFEDLHLMPKPELTQSASKAARRQLVVGLLPAGQVGGMVIRIRGNRYANAVYGFWGTHRLVCPKHAASPAKLVCEDYAFSSATNK